MNAIDRIRSVAANLRLTGTDEAELHALELESIARQLAELFENLGEEDDPRAMGWVDSRGRP